MAEKISLKMRLGTGGGGLTSAARLNLLAKIRIILYTFSKSIMKGRVFFFEKMLPAVKIWQSTEKTYGIFA